MLRRGNNTACITCTYKNQLWAKLLSICLRYAVIKECLAYQELTGCLKKT